MSKNLARKHSMDIPHATAVELPLIVKNDDKAIAMLGGQSKIANAINSLNNQQKPAIQSTEESILELRLRKDPFHHPLQSMLNTKEKVLLKVSIPKQSLPADYYENPGKYTIKELAERNAKDDRAHTRVEPVAIINKSFSFKSMTDFQVSTKNNPIVQDFNELVKAKTYKKVNSFYESHDKLQDLEDYVEEENYANNDHSIPPPPLFTNTKIPYDFKYQKNPFTTVMKDEHGETKVVRKRDTVKLYSQLLEFLAENVPEIPSPELIKRYDELSKADLTGKYNDLNLLQCINLLMKIFEVKPIWLRKHLDDAVPETYKRSLKQALPFVTYIYRSGPWRFCNIKYGVDPRKEKSCWKYQSEYFRVQGTRINVNRAVKGQKLLPKTIKDEDPMSDLRVSDYLLFTGTKLPMSVTYQIGDILDQDICDLISNTREDEFFRAQIDFQDGWISRQVMQTIRRIVRYKLGQLIHDQPIDPVRVAKIVAEDYSVEKEDNDDMDIDIGDKEDEDSLDEEDDEEEESKLVDIDEENVMDRIDRIEGSGNLKGLVGFVKQDSLNRNR